MGLASNLRQITPAPEYPKLRMMGVLGVGDDDRTVILDAGNGKPVIQPFILPCDEGDQVLVAQLSRKNWIVIGPPAAVLGVTGAEIKQMIADALPPVMTIDFGVGPPTGTGWQQAMALPWLHDDGSGNRTSYYQVGDTTPPPSSTPTRTPDPVTIKPNSHGSWRPSGQADPGIMQGAWTGQSWTGALFYGSKIRDACAGKTVDTMKVTVARLNDTSGWNRGVPVHCGTHGRQTRGKVTQLDNVYSLGTLQHGQRKTFTLPNAIVNALKNGDDWGIGFGETNDYVKFTDGSGNINITFS